MNMLYILLCNANSKIFWYLTNSMNNVLILINETINNFNKCLSEIFLNMHRTQVEK